MTEYAKYINETKIEYAPKNYNGISNYNKNIELLKNDGYYEVITAERPSETCTLTYSLKYKKIYEVWTEMPIDKLKVLKREEINKARDEAEQGGFEYLGKVFDSDQISCQRISCAAQAMTNAPIEQTITWTCQDNTTIDLNSEQLLGLVVALATWSNECHKKATNLKEKIEKAQTKEELDEIIW